MVERTSAAEAVERIAWELNYHPGEELSLNQLAQRTDLSWATVRKYVDLLETVQKVAPETEVTDNGVYVGQRSKHVKTKLTEPAERLAVYLMTQAEIQGDGKATIELDRESTVGDIGGEEVLEELVALGWVECSEDTVQLTPIGVKIAGQARAKVETDSQNVERGSQTDWQSQYSNAERETQSTNDRKFEMTPDGISAEENKNQTGDKDNEAKSFSSVSAAQAI